MPPLSTTLIGRNQWQFYTYLHVEGSERRLQSNSGFNEIDIEFFSILKKSLRGHLGLAEWLNAIILCSDSFRLASLPAAWDSLCTVGFMVLNSCSSSSPYSHLPVSTNDKEEKKGISLCLKEYFLGVAHRLLLSVHQSELSYTAKKESGKCSPYSRWPYVQWEVRCCMIKEKGENIKWGLLALCNTIVVFLSLGRVCYGDPYIWIDLWMHIIASCLIRIQLEKMWKR